MSAHAVERPGQLYHGLYPATVAALAGDPDGRQRIEVEFPWLPDVGSGSPRAWATIITPYADDNQGFQMLPAVGSTVVVGFQAGYLDHPYVVGSVWNGNAAAPETFSNSNDKRLIRTRSGSKLEFDDTPGSVKVTVETPMGHHLLLDDGQGSIQVRCASGSTITMNPAGGIRIEAASTIEVSAAMVTVDAPMSRFTGMIECTTLIADAGVVSPSYTPGAGNVW